MRPNKEPETTGDQNAGRHQMARRTEDILCSLGGGKLHSLPGKGSEYLVLPRDREGLGDLRHPTPSSNSTGVLVVAVAVVAVFHPRKAEDTWS